MKFSTEDKQINEFSERVPFGVSKVKLLGLSLEFTETTPAKEYIRAGVVTDDGIEDNALLWFTGGATNISFNTLRQIAVHAGKDNDEKAKIGAAIDACADTETLVDLFNNKLVGAELWLTKYYDAKRTYTGKDGVTRKSINTNIYGYEPKLKPELMPREQNSNLSRVNSVMPGTQDLDVPFNDDGSEPGSKTDAGSTVPKADAWS